MAKVQLTQTQKKLRQFSIWVSGSLHANKQTQEELARYINVDRSGVTRRISGDTPWTLEEFFQVEEFFGEEFRA